MSDNIQELLDGNIAWVEEIRAKEPRFFEELSQGQSPKYLWIGCSDSRVPPTQITKSQPGSIFVQRNIANLVVHTDDNLLSVVYYAVKYLKVEHVVVCGHYGCGGVMAAMDTQSYGYLDNWLMSLKNTYSKHQDELNSIPIMKKRTDRFVEINIQEQVKNLARISFIQDEWAKGNKLQLHGWVYSLEDGLLKDLKVSHSDNSSLEPIFQFNPPQA